MKSNIIILTLFLFLYLSCQKSTEPINEIKWGQESQGLMLSLSPNGIILSEDEPGEIMLTIKNTTSEQISFELYATLNMYDQGKIQRYLSYFDAMASDVNSLYESSKNHPKSEFVLEENGERKYRIDLTKLGWVSPVDSYPPRLDFYQKVEKNNYTLVAEFHLMSDSVITSNKIGLEIN